MKKAFNITDYILVKADTDSDWDNCHFAIIHCTKEWRETMTQRLKAVQSVENEPGFISLNFYDTSVDFYCADENTQSHIDQILGRKDWSFVELDENEQETFLTPESYLNNYKLSFYQHGTAIYSAHGKHSGDEFFTSDFSIKSVLNYHQSTIAIKRLF